ncbi:hypothetical protein B484DRAFT_444365, partial [Ochromonadaceae sp. CCMP2298]
GGLQSSAADPGGRGLHPGAPLLLLLCLGGAALTDRSCGLRGLSEGGGRGAVARAGGGAGAWAYHPRDRAGPLR